jgi:hypothetical protein
MVQKRMNSGGIHLEQSDGLKQDDGQVFSPTIILLFSRTHFATSTCASAPTKMMVLRAGDPLLGCCYPELNHASINLMSGISAIRYLQGSGLGNRKLVARI